MAAIWFVAFEERSLDSLRALRIRILIGCVERSFVAMLLRTDSLTGNLVNNKTPTPLFFISIHSKEV
jgi:hypothetical protein